MLSQSKEEVEKAHLSGTGPHHGQSRHCVGAQWNSGPGQVVLCPAGKEVTKLSSFPSKTEPSSLSVFLSNRSCVSVFLFCEDCFPSLRTHQAVTKEIPAQELQLWHCQPQASAGFLGYTGLGISAEVGGGPSIYAPLSPERSRKLSLGSQDIVVHVTLCLLCVGGKRSLEMGTDEWDTCLLHSAVPQELMVVSEIGAEGQ